MHRVLLEMRMDLWTVLGWPLPSPNLLRLLIQALGSVSETGLQGLQRLSVAFRSLNIKEL